MSLISISNLTFAYEGSYDNIFEQVSLQIDTDWRLGFTGRNGRGKTTFLHLLMGKYEYSGSITSRVSFSYFPFPVANKTARTIEVLDNVADDFALWELERELSLLQVDTGVLQRPFETLSKGEQTKVLLAALFLQDRGYLLIDEPTNHLDLEARQTVSKYLKTKKGFILVSHDRAFLDGCIDHILSINKTNIEIQKGNFSSWWLNKGRQDNYELNKDEKLKKEVSRLKNAVRRTSDWSNKLERTRYDTKGLSEGSDRGYIGHMSAKMMKRSKSIERRRQTAIEEKSQLLKNVETAEDLKIHPLNYHRNRLVSFEKVAVSYGASQVFTDLTFTITQGERVALCGKNGSGKTSIIKLIGGEDICYQGDVQTGSNLILSYVSQDTSHLQGILTDYAQKNGIDDSLFKAILRKLDFSRIQFEKNIADFSEGQKKKVLIAKSLCEKAHLYLWDEPLNFIDILSRMQIEVLLLRYKPTMLFVEHEKTFIEAVATKRIQL